MCPMSCSIAVAAGVWIGRVAAGMGRVFQRGPIQVYLLYMLGIFLMLLLFA